MIEPYNTLLTTQRLIDHINVSMLLDNEAIYEVNQYLLYRKKPSYDDLNRLICKAISTITCPFRFDIDDDNENAVDINSNLQELETNLVAFPRLHFMITSMAPIGVRDRGTRNCYHGIQSIVEEWFNSPKGYFTKF